MKKYIFGATILLVAALNQAVQAQGPDQDDRIINSGGQQGDELLDPDYKFPSEGDRMFPANNYVPPHRGETESPVSADDEFKRRTLDLKDKEPFNRLCTYRVYLPDTKTIYSVHSVHPKELIFEADVDSTNNYLLRFSVKADNKNIVVGFNSDGIQRDHVDLVKEKGYIIFDCAGLVAPPAR